jgi:hypothetical protein
VLATAGPAAADDQAHVFNDKAVWSGGCEVTYSLDAAVARQYKAAVPVALRAITARSGIAFTRLPDSDPATRVRITLDASLGGNGGSAGWGGTEGTVQLAPARRVTIWHDPAINRTLLETLVAHEVLHTFGLDHDSSTTTEREVMHPVQDTGRSLVWGPSDIAGMTLLAQRNGCTPTDTSRSPRVGPVYSKEDADRKLCEGEWHGTWLATRQVCLMHGRVTVQGT